LLIEQEQGRSEYLTEQVTNISLIVILGVFLINLTFFVIAIVIYKRRDRKVKTRLEQIALERQANY
jgi:hypothetical protein